MPRTAASAWAAPVAARRWWRCKSRRGAATCSSKESTMADNDGQWERGLIEKLATAALKEQRRARLWGIFWKTLTFVYLTVVLVMAIDWQSGGDAKSGGKHTALVDIKGVIAPGTDTSADKVTLALQSAFKDKNTQGIVLRINSPGGSPVQSQTIY